MSHIDFAILNSHVTVTYLRFIKNTYFYAVKHKIKNSCIFSYYLRLYIRCSFFQARRLLVKLTVSKLTSVRKSYILKFVKK